MLVMPPASIAASTTPAPVACPATPRIATIAIDPASTIDVTPDQSFIIALRATHDGGYAWRLDRISVRDLVEHDQTISIDDVAYENLNAAASAHRGMIVGGESTEYWAFTALEAGTVQLDFTLGRGSADPKPVGTKTFTVSIKGCSPATPSAGPATAAP